MFSETKKDQAKASLDNAGTSASAGDSQGVMDNIANAASKAGEFV